MARVKKSRVAGLPLDELVALAEIGAAVKEHAPGLVTLLSGGRRRRRRKEAGNGVDTAAAPVVANPAPKRRRRKAKVAKAGTIARPSAIDVGEE